MYNIVKNIRIKKEILVYLDQETEYISTQELSDSLPDSSLSISTIYKFCNEIKQDIEKIYSPEEMDLISNSRYGIKLTRNNAILQPLIEEFFFRSLLLHYKRYFSKQKTCYN